MLLGLNVYASDEEVIKQLTFPDESFRPYTEQSEISKKGSFKVTYLECEIMDEMINEERPYSEYRSWSKLCYQSVLVNDNSDVVGFSFLNNSLNSINPYTDEHQSERQFVFSFPERSLSQAHLRVTENSALTGRMSHDLLESTLIFLPRKVIPYIQVESVVGGQLRRVTLPTNEVVVFNAETNEIVEGVLDEKPMDKNPNRSTRKFAGLSYNGRGIMIRADRRAGSPELVYDQSFNSNERPKMATIFYRDQVCYVPKELVWKNAKNHDSKQSIRFHSDQEFLDEVINPKCGWKLTLNDLN